MPKFSAFKWHFLRDRRLFSSPPLKLWTIPPCAGRTAHDNGETSGRLSRLPWTIPRACNCGHVRIRIVAVCQWRIRAFFSASSVGRGCGILPDAWARSRSHWQRKMRGERGGNRVDSGKDSWWYNFGTWGCNYINDKILETTLIRLGIN